MTTAAETIAASLVGQPVRCTRRSPQASFFRRGGVYTVTAVSRLEKGWRVFLSAAQGREHVVLVAPAAIISMSTGLALVDPVRPACTVDLTFRV